MTQLKAYIADNHDIVKALKDMIVTTAVAVIVFDKTLSKYLNSTTLGEISIEKFLELELILKSLISPGSKGFANFDIS